MYISIFDLAHACKFSVAHVTCYNLLYILKFCIFSTVSLYFKQKFIKLRVVTIYIIFTMIKSVLISRLTDGLIFCESSEGYMDEHLLQVRHKVKKYHAEVTSYNKLDQTPLKQIEHASYGIFYKVSSYVVFTIIVDKAYPLKLANGFIDSLVNPFFDQAKCVLGSANFKSRLQAISSDHYFVKFDRTIKSKKKQFEDPNSIKNVDRMKKQLENIHEIMKENMNMLEGRKESLQATQERARKISEDSKKFDQSTKKLVWTYWIKNNLIWIVAGLTIVILYFLIF